MNAHPSSHALDAARPVRRATGARVMGLVGAPVRSLLLALLASAGVVAVAFVWWPAPEAPVAAPAGAPADRPATAAVPVASAPAVVRRSLASAPVARVGAAGDLSVPRPTAVPASASLPWLALDVSSLQRSIQQALAGGQRGKAGEAARHIEACQGMDRLGAGMRASLEVRQQRAPSPANAEAMAQIERLQAACQAVDAASRAQLVPLLRRSLAEGDKGAAASLVVALGPDFKPATEPETVAALTRDASTCDLPSEGVSNRLGARVVTPDELGALREVQRRPSNWLGLPAGSPAARAAFDSLKARLRAPPAADPVQLARLVADVEPHCVDQP